MECSANRILSIKVFHANTKYLFSIFPTRILNDYQQNCFEVLLLLQGKRSEFEKPWKTPPPGFNESKEIEVFYPSDTEDTGIVRIGWRGPSIVENIRE